MKSYCWGNVGKEETEKDEFVKRYAEWIENPRQGKCPYSDPDEVNNDINYVKNPEFYIALTDFLKCSKEKIQESCGFVLEFKEPTNLEDESRKMPGDRTITVQKDENDYLYLTSDQFGFSANKDIYDNKNDRLKKQYPFVKYVENYGGSDSLVGETIWYTRTIGGSFLWPKVDQNGWRSLYNENRGVGSYIEDRADLTLYEIKEFYDEYSVEKDYEKIKYKLSEKGSNLLKYSDAEYIYKWLSIFKNFKTYVDFLCFDDFVNKEDDEYYPKDIFTGKSITKDNISEYREKGKSKYKFIQNKATKNDLEKAFYNLIFWTIARSARMETIISKMSSNRLSQQNSIIRALKLLEILKSGTDRKHKLTQEQLLFLMKKMDGSCTLKTMRTDLRNLMSAINPILDDTGEEYKDHPEDYRIIYDGIEEGRHRMSGIQYIHEFTNDELDLLIGLIKGSGGVSKESIDSITGKLKKLGSRFYKYTSDVIQTIPEHNTIDKTFINHNIWIINAAITNNKQISFIFNGYGKDGKLIPVRDKRYEANPYYVVSYLQKYYMLCTHGKYEDVHIYRLDLMSDIELCEENRESVRGVPELEHSNAKEYMDRHLNMFYDEPRTVTLKVKNISSGYTSVHDQFGDKYIYKKKIDDEYDEIEVIASGNAIIDYAIQYSELVEIIRPKDLRNKLIDKINNIQNKYIDNK